MQHIVANGHRLACFRQGSGPAIVFAHALGASSAIWRPQLDALAADFDCVLYDVRGHGASAVPAGPWRMEDLAADALALLDGLGIERCVFAGVSMGGMIGMHLALLAPQRLRGLVVADSAAGFAADGRAAWSERMALVAAQGVAPLVGTMMDRWFTADFRHRHPDRVEPVAAALAATPVAGYLACCAAIRDLDVLARLPEIACPTLVVCGEADPSTPLPLSQAIAAAIPGARLEVLPGLNHLAHFERPDLFNPLLRDFLRRLPN